MDANAALDRIAELVALDDGVCWADAYSKLESIANLVIETGRTVEGWGA
ncbi:hypothetical protein E3_0475 [Rhodococcus phage E3]|nr:hypothetical protein M176_gp051 [Rhodococcus phage E3]AEQ20961.1 hypothetical protein E3_0475 [Rhodococcus phage E3]